MITAISMYLRLFILCNANEKIAINGGILATLLSYLGSMTPLIFFLFFLVSYVTKPQQRWKKEESERRRGERDQIKFFNVRFVEG